MSIKKHIPNLFTLGNLLCGTLATVFAVEGDFELTAALVVLGIIFDFFDGFLARLLGVSGELGKQLDSLADMVTSGVVPGIVMFKILILSLSVIEIGDYVFFSKIDTNLAYIGFVITLAACYRLAKFNIDTRQSESFIGLPTPAMSLFVVSLPIIHQYTEIDFVKNLVFNNYFLLGVTIVLSFLMNANLPLLSFKFKSYGFKENIYKYLLILISIILIVTLQFIAVPLIIVIYILLSIIQNLSLKKHAV